MLSDSIHTDVTINTPESTLQAHKAVLSSASPVFFGMFSFDSRERRDSEISMPDMSLGCCSVFLKYIYGCIDCDEFWEYRVELLKAADKYCMSELMNFCQDSLVTDLDTENVFSRLEIAYLIGAEKLKNACITCVSKFV
jgi:speckle-type POZ protein